VIQALRTKPAPSPKPTGPPPPVTPEDRAWDRKAEQAATGQLQRLRSLAGQWRTGLTGLTSLLSAAAVITGTQTAANLTPGRRLAVAILVGAALLFLIIGSASALRASFGDPGPNMLLTGPNIRDWEHDEAELAVRLIKASRGLLIVGLVLLGAAGVVAFTNPPQMKPPLVQVVPVGNPSAPVCGSLRGGRLGTIDLSITAEDGATTLRSFSPQQIKSMKPVAQCG
jgi:hypothetical protein